MAERHQNGGIKMLNWFVDLAFMLLGGTAIVHSPILILWVVFFVLFGAVMFIGCLYIPKIGPLLGVLIFFGVLILTIGVPTRQQAMLSECKSVHVTGENISTDITVCRSKENIHGEFGEWRVYKQN